MTIIPFGVHEGKDLEDVPSGYLRKILNPSPHILRLMVKCPVQLSPEFYCDVKEELQHRDRCRGHF